MSSLTNLALLALLAPLATPQDCKTTLVSVGTGGGSLGFGGVGGGRISADGRSSIFTVVEYNDPQSPIHAYVRDEVTGITTELPGPYADDLSGDGRYAIWDGGGLFVTDLQLGTTTRVDIGASGQMPDGMSLWGRISDDGRFVAFTSSATNLILGDTNGKLDTFVRDLQTGTTERVSLPTGGGEGDGDSWNPPAISADGRYVAFSSMASNFAAGDANADFDVFVHDRTAGTTELVSRSLSATTGPGPSWVGGISGDGRFVSFDSLQVDLVPGDTNGTWDAFVRDTQLGVTARISTTFGGGQSLAQSYSGPLSGDGRLAVFSSASTRIVPGDLYPGFDVYVRDMISGTVERVNVDSQDNQLGGDCFAVDMSPDGRFVSFRRGNNVLVRGCPQTVTRYGEAKVNSAACRPWITWTGTPSASAGSGFVVRAQGELNRHTGRFLYGFHSQPNPPLPNLLVAPPIRRLPLARTGGTPTGLDCTGSLEIDFNDWIAHGGDPALLPGVTVYGQFWSTDGGFPPPFDYGMSDAVELTIQP